MIIQPKIRGFICTTAHPRGCWNNVVEQINYVKNNINNSDNKKIKNVLIIGASTGYGLASRIVTGFGYQANTIGVSFERSPLAQKTASAGWYNSMAFDKLATKAGLYAKSINIDAFSNDAKQEVINLIKEDWNNQIDLIIYSIASPRRVDPISNITYNSVLKPIGQSYSNTTIDTNTNKISNITIQPAINSEIESTVKVMGGEDLQLWVDALDSYQLLNNCTVVAYSYIGPNITYPIYRQGTIGKAKEHLEQTILNINQFLAKQYNGRAIISVNKALVTQSSSAIPVVPLYISLLYKIMKAKNIHEGCIEQITRLFKDKLFNSNITENPIRMDDLEMGTDVQQEINQLWPQITENNIATLADLDGYREDFLKLFGFGHKNIDYNLEYDISTPTPEFAQL